MAYAEIDPIIDIWAQATAASLHTEWADRPARFVYLPGLRAFECFQIAIEPPADGHVVVLAGSVDIDDGSEFEERLEGPIDTLPAMLERATKTVRHWANRPTTHLR